MHSHSLPFEASNPSVAGSVQAVGWLVGLVSLASLASLIDFAEATHDPETAIVAVAWGLAVCSALWLGASVLYWRRHLHVESPRRGRLERLTMPGSKQVAKGLLAVSLTVLPACGESDPSPPQLVHLGQVDPRSTSTTSTTMIVTTMAPPSSAAVSSTTTGAPATTEPTTTAPTTAPTTVPPTTVAPTTAPPTSPPPAPTEPNETQQPSAARSDEHLVVAGDHLWSIAASETELRLGRQPSTAEVTEYWAKLIASNRTRLSSGDPNMIFPGEILVLP